jgi:hypothetical protein
MCHRNRPAQVLPEADESFFVIEEKGKGASEAGCVWGLVVPRTNLQSHSPAHPDGQRRVWTVYVLDGRRRNAADGKEGGLPSCHGATLGSTLNRVGSQTPRGARSGALMRRQYPDYCVPLVFCSRYGPWRLSDPLWTRSRHALLDPFHLLPSPSTGIRMWWTRRRRHLPLADLAVCLSSSRSHEDVFWRLARPWDVPCSVSCRMTSKSPQPLWACKVRVPGCSSCFA